MNCQKNTGSNYLWYYECKGTTKTEKRKVKSEKTLFIFVFFVLLYSKS